MAGSSVAPPFSLPLRCDGDAMRAFSKIAEKIFYQRCSLSATHMSMRLWATTAHFFSMLRALEKSAEDIVFLGDIFDLWIALPRYERAIHHRFLSWCADQKLRRGIGFIEGNHEYFLARRKGRFFSWCTNGAFWKDGCGNIFCHGDQVNRLDRNYLWFRRAVKNDLSQTALRWLPLGPGFVEQVKGPVETHQSAFPTLSAEAATRSLCKGAVRRGGTDGLRRPLSSRIPL